MKSIPFESILVSCGFNANHHYFPQEELKKNYKTAEGQPVNVDHIASDIVGSIKEAEPITDLDMLTYDGNIVNHIKISSVVWVESLVKLFGREDAETKIAKVICGTYGVSMECVPNNVDILIKHKGKLYRLPFNENTAYLILHTPDFGGTGFLSNGDYVGLRLADFDFVGVALTETPAGHYSKILSVGFVGGSVFDDYTDEEETIESIKKIANNTEEKQMEKELETLKAQIAELTTKVTELETAKSNLEASLAEKDATVVSATQLSTEKDTKLVEAQTKVDELTTLVEELKETVTSKEASITELNQKLINIETATKMANRKAKLAEINVEIDEKSFEKYANMTDEAFEAMIDLADKAIAKCKKDIKEEKEKAEKEEAEIEEETTDASVTIIATEKIGLPIEKQEESFGKRLIRKLSQ